jgi:hypothetical protein
LLFTIWLLPFIGKSLGLFIVLMAPLVFLVGVIAGLNLWGAHNRFIDRLGTFGKVAEATVSYVDEGNWAGLHYIDSGGVERYGTLDFRYYPQDVIQTIHPDAKLRIVYIDALVSEGEKTALADYYERVLAAPAVTPDVWWILGLSWLLIAIYPKFVFIGFVDFSEVLKPYLKV